MFAPALADALQSKIILELFIVAPLIISVAVWIINKNSPKKSEPFARRIQFVQDNWRRELGSWNIRVTTEQIAPIALELERCQKILMPMYVWIVNQFAVAITFGFLLFLLPGLHLAAGLESLWKLGIYSSLYIVYIFNNGLRYMHGVDRLRQDAKLHRTVGMLRRRSMGDYRSNVFPLLIGIITVATLVLFFIAVPDLTIPFNVNRSLAIAFLLTLYAGGFSVVIMLSEILIRRIVRYPQLFIDADPAQAVQIDTLFRAKAIGIMQMLENFGIDLVALSELSSIQSMVYSHTPWLIQDGMVGIGILVMAQIVSMGYIMSGKLGGTITGWPWQLER